MQSMLPRRRDWATEYDGWKDTAFDDEPIVYIWADGVHSGLRGEDDKLCALVIIGVMACGQKRFLAIHCPAGDCKAICREGRMGFASPHRVGARFCSTSKAEG